MKKQVTSKFIRNSFKNIIVLPYEALHFGLSYKQPEYYNAGTYGWNYDAYIIDFDTVIITGYRPIKGNIELSRKQCNAFDEFVRNNMNNLNYEQHKELLEKFIKTHV